MARAGALRALLLIKGRKDRDYFLTITTSEQRRPVILINRNQQRLWEVLFNVYTFLLYYIFNCIGSAVHQAYIYLDILQEYDLGALIYIQLQYSIVLFQSSLKGAYTSVNGMYRQYWSLEVFYLIVVILANYSSGAIQLNCVIKASNLISRKVLLTLS